MKKIIVLILLINFVQANFAQSDEKLIHELINNWHKAAAKADADAYFGFMAADCIYIGTDASERWTKDEFVKFAKPYFDKGKAWNFKPIERQIYFAKNKKTAWFNETLDTWMGICRSSGVLEKTKGQWKLKHYHLSVTVPNDKIQKFIKLVAGNKPQHNE